MAKRNKQTKNQKEYQKERRRLLQAVRRAEKQGYIFPEDIVPKLPKRVTKKQLKNIQKIKPKQLYKKAIFVYQETGEIVPAEQRKQEADRRKEYWEKVNNLINSRVINGYRLPNSFTKEIDGKKTILTPSDFFNYLSEARYDDNNGNKITAYQSDLNKLTDDEFLAREMLDAWLMFTGGTYKDLIDMAVKEEQVRKLVVKSKQNRSSKSVRVVKKQTGKANIDDIIF